MKKILEKIVSIALALIALFFVVLMLVVSFKPEYADNLSNPFVHVMLIIFSGIFAVLATINIYSAFMDAEKINNVLLFKAKGSATKATISVVNKTAKNATKLVEGAKLKKVYLFVDENNDLKIRLDLKIKGEKVEDIVNTVRATVATTFADVLGLEFATIDFKLIKIKNEFKPDKIKVDAQVAVYKKEIEIEKEKERIAHEEKVEITEPVETEATEVPEVENDVVAAEAEAIAEDVITEEAVSETATEEAVVAEEAAPLEMAVTTEESVTAEEVQTEKE